jgi:hypothetical protein
MGASVKLRLAALAAICNAESSLWVPHALRRMSAPGREPNNGEFSVTKAPA